MPVPQGFLSLSMGHCGTLWNVSRRRVQRAPGIPHALYWARDKSNDSGASRRETRTRVCCLTICITQHVVPAKAGTHSHRRSLEQKVSASASKMIGHGVWVPAFAGTTKESGWSFPSLRKATLSAVAQRGGGSDEAIHSSFTRFTRRDGLLAEPVIGRAFARPLARNDGAAV